MLCYLCGTQTNNVVKILAKGICKEWGVPCFVLFFKTFSLVLWIDKGESLMDCFGLLTFVLVGKLVSFQIS